MTTHQSMKSLSQPRLMAPSAPKLLCGLFASALLLALSGQAAAGPNDRKAKGNTRTSVNKNTNVNKNNNSNRNTNINNNKNTNVNVNNNSNRNTNVNVNTNRHVDVDVDVDRGFHPVAAVATVAVTAAIIGSMTPTLPPACVPVQIGNVLYQQCGNNWYQPQYVGSSVQYVVVVAPR
jgi:hypothetical protein